MTLSTDTTADLAEQLYSAYQNASPIRPLTERHDLTIDDAYAIQEALIENRIRDEGASKVGHKIGLTSEGIQNQLNVSEPDYGAILDTMVLDEQRIPTDSLIQPRVEAEIGFLLERTLEPPVTRTDVLRATGSVLPVVEVIDSRVVDWDIHIEDTIADNASSAYIIPGESVYDPAQQDLPMEAVHVYVNGTLEQTGVGGEVLGNPARSVAWLANKLAEFNGTLEEGDLVLSGSFTPAVDVEPGDVVTIRFATMDSMHLGVD